MSRVIRISDETFKRLQDKARAAGLVFVSPDNLLRHILDMPQAGRNKGKEELSNAKH